MHPVGFQSFILFLKIESDSAFLMSSGTISQVRGPLYLIVSTPLFTVLTCGITKSPFPRSLRVKRFAIIAGLAGLGGGTQTDAVKVLNLSDIWHIESSKGGPLQTQILDVFKFENASI